MAGGEERRQVEEAMRVLQPSATTGSRVLDLGETGLRGQFKSFKVIRIDIYWIYL